MNEKGSSWLAKLAYIGGRHKIFLDWKAFCLENGLEDRDMCDFIYKHYKI